MIIWKSLRKHLRFKLNKLQLLQIVSDRERRFKFCIDMIDKIDNNNNLLNKIVFSDEPSFDLSGMGN